VKTDFFFFGCVKRQRSFMTMLILAPSFVFLNRLYMIRQEVLTVAMAQADGIANAS
jgi:hypothetical protein